VGPSFEQSIGSVISSSLPGVQALEDGEKSFMNVKTRLVALDKTFAHHEDRGPAVDKAPVTRDTSMVERCNQTLHQCPSS